MHRALDQALRLELAQPLGEQPVGDPGHGGEDLAEVEGSVEQLEEDRSRPAAADQLHRGVEARADHLRGISRHGGVEGSLRGGSAHRLSLAKPDLGPDGGPGCRPRGLAVPGISPHKAPALRGSVARWTADSRAQVAIAGLTDVRLRVGPAHGAHGPRCTWFPRSAYARLEPREGGELTAAAGLTRNLRCSPHRPSPRRQPWRIRRGPVTRKRGYSLLPGDRRPGAATGGDLSPGNGALPHFSVTRRSRRAGGRARGRSTSARSAWTAYGVVTAPCVGG